MSVYTFLKPGIHIHLLTSNPALKIFVHSSSLLFHVYNSPDR